MALNITKENFAKVIESSDTPVLIDFWAAWCGPCQMLSPIIDEVGEELKDKVKVVKLNVDENPETSKQYQISGIPTVILFENGEMKEKIVGFRMKQDYIDAINK